MIRFFNAILASMLALQFAGCSGANLSSQFIDTAADTAANLGDMATGIIGGRVVDPRDPKDIAEQTTAAVILYNQVTKEVIVCSAVLVARDLLLTAAHCLWPMNERPRGPSFLKFVSFSRHIDLNDPQALADAETIHESSYLLAPNYHSKTLENDIAMIRLHLPLKAGLAPVKILRDTSALVSPLAVTVAGFGRASTETKSAADLVLDLKTLDSKIGTQSEKKLPSAKPIVTSPTQHPAEGDSGGPAFVTLKGHTFVWGLDSFNTQGNNEYYTVIARELPWLTRAATQLGSALPTN